MNEWLRLTLIRHAKSSWRDVTLDDRQRPLAKRGRQAAPLMALNNKQRLLEVDAFYCSTAVRAASTLELMSDAIDIDQEKCQLNAQLYSFSANHLVSFIKTLPSNKRHIALIGHNPALTDLINFFSDDHLLNLPTAAMVTLRLKIPSWSQAGSSCGRWVYFDCPKNYAR